MSVSVSILSFAVLSALFRENCLTYPSCTAMLAVILAARETMLSIDLSELKDLQYEYKGA